MGYLWDLRDMYGRFNGIFSGIQWDLTGLIWDIIGQCDADIEWGSSDDHQMLGYVVFREGCSIWMGYEWIIDGDTRASQVIR